VGTIDHPGFRDPGVRVGGGGVRSSERFFFVGPGRSFLSSSRGGTTDARRRDATPGRGGARAHRRLVRRRVRDVRDVVRLRVRDARFARVLLRGRPPERRGARSVASAGAGSSAAARGAATIAGDPRRAYRCFPALGGVEGCDPSTLRRAGGGAAGMSIASIEGRGAARGEVCGRAERRVRGTRPEVAAKTTTSDDGIVGVSERRQAENPKRAGGFGCIISRLFRRMESRLSQQRGTRPGRRADVMRDAGPSSPPVASISVGASAAGPRPGVPAPMPDFRDRERDEADAQAKNTARQREVLRERAARRAKERRKEAKKAAQAQTVAGNARARAGAPPPHPPAPPPSPPRARRPRGALRRRSGASLPPSGPGTWAARS
jgi:hypothetical protein